MSLVLLSAFGRDPRQGDAPPKQQRPAMLKPGHPREILCAQASFGAQSGRQVSSGPADGSRDVEEPAWTTGSGDQLPGTVYLGWRSVIPAGSKAGIHPGGDQL